MWFQILTGGTRSYTVHEGPTPRTDRMDRAEALQFIKDGFAFPAFIAGPLWLLAHQLWAALLSYVVAAFAIVGLYLWLGLPQLIVAVLFVGLHLIIGFEADSIARGNLEQKGWANLGSVSGNTAQECERRFLETWLPSQPVLATRSQHSPKPPAASQAHDSTAIQPAVATDRTVAGRFAALL